MPNVILMKIHNMIDSNNIAPHYFKIGYHMEIVVVYDVN